MKFEITERIPEPEKVVIVTLTPEEVDLIKWALMAHYDRYSGNSDGMLLAGEFAYLETITNG